MSSLTHYVTSQCEVHSSHHKDHSAHHHTRKIPYKYKRVHKHSFIPSSSNARKEIAHDLYTSANRQGWKGAVPYICDINSESLEDFFSCHSRAVDEARDPHSAFRVGTLICFSASTQQKFARIFTLKYMYI